MITSIDNLAKWTHKAHHALLSVVCCLLLEKSMV